MSTTNDIKNLIAKRGAIKGQVTRFKSFFNNIKPDLIHELEIRLKATELLFDKFSDIQDLLDVFQPDEAQQELERSSFENEYYKVVSDAHSYILNNKVKLTDTVAPTSLAVDCNASLHPHFVNLPKINLPTFTGSYNEWLDFSETFTSLIHNDKRLPDVLKFRYLKSCLRDEAAGVIHLLEVSSDNYAAAWDLLEKRYNNKSFIAKSHINSLFSITSLQKESHVHLRQTVDAITKHIKALESLNYNNGDLILIVLIVSKLDPVTRRHWELSQKDNEIPTLNNLLSFLQEHCKMLETLHLSKQENLHNSSYNPIKTRKPDFKTNTHVAINKLCAYCKQSHSIFNCNSFLSLKIQDRISEVKKLHLCLNCLKGNHYVKDCKSSRCKECNQLHNTLLHIIQPTGNDKSFKNNNIQDLDNNKVVGANDSISSSKQIKSVSTHTLNNNCTEVLLATAVVQINDQFNNPHNCRVLLDNGSQLNFISKACCDKLNLIPKKVNALVSGINQVSTNINSEVEVTMYSLRNNYKLTTNCLVLNEITQQIPSITFNKNYLNIPQNLNLADFNFNKSSDIDILLGASVFYDMLCVGQIKLGKNMPVLQKTLLGWIISGPLSLPNNTTKKKGLAHHCINKSILNQITKFWELEEINVPNKLSQDEQFCETHFVNNTIRTSNGQFVVKIPFRENVSELGDSKQIAIKRFHLIEKKLSENPSLKKQYVDFINEYKNLGHMTKLNSENLNVSLQYFLPHHPVVRESSLTTKLRVVFDGSAKTTSGLSLNQVQYVGPTIQQDLFSIILRFRKHNIAITADISKMYRQVMVEKSNRNLQRIFWRENTDQPLDCYELNTVTYGTASAPFLATRCLYQLAIENQSKYPEVCNLIRNDFYVDDLLTGADTLEHSLKIHTQITKILDSGSFPLCKWSCNNKEFLKIISADNSDNNLVYICDDPNSKTLGLTWNSNHDTIQYSVKPSNRGKITKRSILSTISQIFDPLGLIAPLTIKAKLIMQELWKVGLSWDESVPNNICTRWFTFSNNLDSINNIQTPRHVLCKSSTLVELHGFCDASTLAYGACVFIKSIDENSIVHTNLLCAKSRVAPLRTITLPRLELCGALLLAQLVNKIINTMDIKFNEIFYWCDSTIVLNWINSPAYRWQTFVSNRVSQIQNICDVSNWRHVCSNENPADLLTRGINGNQLNNCQLWWKGPPWLQTNLDLFYSKICTKFKILDEIPETKVNKIVLIATTKLEIFNKYSSLIQLLKVTAYIRRFISNSRTKIKSERKIGLLSSSEINDALKCLVRIVQRECFPKELNILLGSKQRIIKSKIAKLSPFLDNENLIRVGGRLRNSKIPYDTKHPYLLPKKHTLTILILKHEHEKLLHCGPQILLSSVRETFWPIAGRSLARKVVHSCIKCFRANPKSSTQLMGDLPEPRITPSPPFSHCGVDYAGPFYLKDKKSRGAKTIKTYICLFICFATKAIHLELVGDLSAESFIAALRRFCARRGKPVSMYSDNGTNFVKANKELQELSGVFNNKKCKEQIINAMVTEGIEWKFIPPNAPHFGGLWEAGVKSVKIHLLRIFKSASLIYEEFLTVLTQIEAIVNSRPLCPLSADPNDLSSLTPGHFLIGKPLTAPPDSNMLDIPETRLSRFQRLQTLVQHYWKRWSVEYITELQEKSKWFNNKTNDIKLDSMVIIKDETQPPLNWKLGRVIQLHTGEDGLVRVVSVKTQNGVIKRPIVKLCVLPLQ